MDNTYSRISGISADQVRARVLVPKLRILAANEAMTERWAKRGPAPVCPADMKSPELPILPTYPEEWFAAAVVPSYAQRFLSQQSSPLHSRGLEGEIRADATPAQLVAAIHAADWYADECERLAAEYAGQLGAELTFHVEAQAGAVRELAGLVAGGR